MTSIDETEVSPEADIPAGWPPEVKLSRSHREELIASAISPEVAVGRRYRTVPRAQAHELERAHIPGWARKDNSLGPWLAIPRYAPSGAYDGLSVKPRRAVKLNGRSAKYAHPKGQANSLDVHPFNRDKIADPTVPLFVVEGVKKADAVTSLGKCAVAVNGVYGWRRTQGAEAVWESVPLKGRKVCLLFDSDTNERADLQRAVSRLGWWLRTKGARVLYVIIPSQPGGLKVGIDDYLASGGRFDTLSQVASLMPPLADEKGEFTDTKLADHYAERVLADEFVSTGKALGWLRWTGVCWEECGDDVVLEQMRVAAREQFDQMIDAAKSNPDKLKIAQAFKATLSASRLRAILSLLVGHSLLRIGADCLDTHPDMLNTPDGIVDLRTGEVTEHDPKMLFTKITRGSYRPEYRHPDWEKALEALPAQTREYVQYRVGQAATGHPPASDDALFLLGPGSNGKSLLASDGVMPALGSYSSLADSGLLLGQHDRGASPERASLRGTRFVLVEELPEGGALSVSELKRILGTSVITARQLYSGLITFDVSHTLFVTSNYLPIVSETDDGTWRRLCPLKFPYKFVSGEPERENERSGDATLKARVKAGADGQHDAVVTWIVEGARRFYANPDEIMPANRPRDVVEQAEQWRGSADRIFGFLADRVEKAEGSAIMRADLYHVFTEWLQEQGHHPWSQETFFKRLQDHAYWLKLSVSEERTRKTKALSRPDGSGFGRPSRSRLPTVPPQPHVYWGIRFVTE